MTNKKLTQWYIDNPVTIAPEDLLYVVDDPAGTPLSGAFQAAQLMTNRYRIVPSVASNNLTIAITHLDGTTSASTSKPLYFKVGDTIYTLVAAASYTKNAGTNWHNSGSTELATKAIDYFVYAIAETGASAGLKFGHSRISHAMTMADFVNTTTNEKYIAGNWTNFNTTDVVTVIGRFRATLSATASFNWSVSTSVVVNSPIFETDTLQWAPQMSCNSSMTITSPTAVVSDYKVSRNKLEFSGRLTGTLVTPASTQVLFTLPFQLLRTSGVALCSQLYNEGGSTSIGFAGGFHVAGTPDKCALITYNFANHTLGAGIWEPFGVYYI